MKCPGLPGKQFVFFFFFFIFFSSLNRNLFYHSFEGWKSKTKIPLGSGLFSGEGSFLGLEIATIRAEAYFSMTRVCIRRGRNTEVYLQSKSYMKTQQLVFYSRKHYSSVLWKLPL